MPLILLLLLFMVDRDNSFQKIGYIILLFSYTGVLILRILYAKKEWHKEFSTSDLANDSKINKMSDYEGRLGNKNDLDKESVE